MVVHSLCDRLLRRELDYRHRNDVRGIYGDKTWVTGLDIVNELGGHRGCVNALSWSKSGRLLASGSDDTNIVLHSYQPDGQTKPFSISTSISTGHSANIFSVKFMPHSNDSVLVSCAGDGQVRVFDVEHSSRSQVSSNGVPGRTGGTFHNGIRQLSEGDTNAKVFKSHSDRVKRIVTESSPFLFLTCSEDGEVRQWDLRQPSSAYPEPRRGPSFLGSQYTPDDSVPPPLISYRRLRLDLNTISCASTQPHYIALGGAHLHCFLHDRRMIGRDLSLERGSPASDFSVNDDFHGDMMGQATQCVRRFAPNGQTKMSGSANGHITACKISEANPNELVASWSGDHIYSFDIVQSPDAREQRDTTTGLTTKEGASPTESQDRKRKRTLASSPQGSAAKHQRSRSATQGPESHDDVALRVRYENGQSEDIAVEGSVPAAAVESARRAVLTPSQKRSLKIAKTVVKLRRLIFSLESSSHGHESSDVSSDVAQTFARAAATARSCLTVMDNAIRRWRYPLDDIAEELALHKALRKQRDRARRFVQAAGVLSLLLSEDRLQQDIMATELEEISAPSTEGPFEDHTEIFRYDFLKAILAWLRGGSEGLIEAFRKKPAAGRKSYRFPIPENAGANSIDKHLIRHLLLICGQHAIPDLDVSRFEHDEQRQLFSTEREAVTAFSHAVELATKVEKEPSSSSGSSNQDSAQDPVISRTSYKSPVVRRFWALKVARGLLLNAAEGVDFALVDRAFGGLGNPRAVDSGRDQTDINPDEDDPQVLSVGITTARTSREREAISQALLPNERSAEEEPLSESHLADGPLENSDDSIYEEDDEEEEEDDDDDSSDEYDDFSLDEAYDRMLWLRRHDPHGSYDSDDSGDSDEAEAEMAVGQNRILWRTVSQHAQLRETVDAHVPVSSHTRTYQGHCNVKTVKDVNFYGLRDEYVVSGSDSGHVFIWDRKTAQLLNILEGDGDVVNVVQGHPHEPMMAVSGIDNTIKIFSADRRAQRNARFGINLAATQYESANSSGLLGARARLQRLRAQQQAAADPDAAAQLASAVEQDSSEDDRPPETGWTGSRAGLRGGLATRRRMHNSYEIVANNDAERQGGLRDAYITRSMLQQLALHFRNRHGAPADETGEDVEDGEFVDDEGRPVEIDDENCRIM